ncbi:octanoyl-[acyl-carrier-protein]:protein N-octanoyltransferase LIPT2, mitochondrial-like [Watersipora subatra]|uniref:octanoyl-[acyl-carrier-protein]:protein N-octanoyltransferase LIPT2, mitochondrial-like n=1 Tax=Watersipora subatra TaxID=2589382 RepID=UPI00355ADDD0
MSRSNPVVQLVNLSRRSFRQSLEVQDKLKNDLVKLRLGDSQALPIKKEHHTKPFDEKSKHYVLFVEHFPVYTSGLRDKAFSQEDIARLEGLGAEVCRTNRGGLATFHGPGQLVAYPILNLKELGIGLRQYVAKLERCLVQTCKSFGIDAYTNDLTGVWAKDCKIASIGVNAKRHITSHGVALNCSNDLSWFDHITPCGLEDVAMTSLTEQTGQLVDVREAEWSFLKTFIEEFGVSIVSRSDSTPAISP